MFSKSNEAVYKEYSFVEFLDLENIGIAVGVLQFCCVLAGKKVYLSENHYLGVMTYACLTQYSIEDSFFGP